MKTGAKGRVYWQPIPVDEADSHLLSDGDMFDSDDLKGNPEDTIDDEMTNEGDEQSLSDECESTEVSLNEKSDEPVISKPTITGDPAGFDIEPQDDE